MNPMQIIQMMMGNNPMARNNPMINNAMNMAQSNNIDGLKQLAENLCKEKNVSLEDIQKQIMQRFGMR